MSTSIFSPTVTASGWPFMSASDAASTCAWRNGQPITLAQFQRDVTSVLAVLPPRAAMINLCDDRYRFIVAFAAAQCAKQTVLLPSARVEQVVAEVERAHVATFRFDDPDVDDALARGQSREHMHPEADHIAMIGFTSGSTGQPKPFPK